MTRKDYAYRTEHVHGCLEANIGLMLDFALAHVPRRASTMSPSSRRLWSYTDLLCTINLCGVPVLRATAHALQRGTVVQLDRAGYTYDLRTIHLS